MDKKRSPTPAARYLRIAGDLRRAIAAGRYPVGAQLPTEHALCRSLGVSRFTVREAIRVLAAAGLVKRKPRAGTVVAALPDDTRYRHSIGSVRDLVQYAQTTRFQYMYIGRVQRQGQQWIYAVALRREVGRAKPLALTRLYLNPALKGIERALRGAKGAVYSIIEREFGVRIERVEQVISGVVLDAEDAENLGVEPGTPGLSIRRSYFDEGGRLLELADNLHPASRFAYRMELRR
jgi:GntR family transcriptional regulator